jgi:SAM-dependent methyltransferase
MLLHRYLADVASSDERVLDLGTRDGRKMRDVDATVIGADVAVDPASDADVEFVIADGCRLPFRSNAFDYVIGNALLEHVRDRPTLLAEVRRVLHSRGEALFSFPHRYQLTKPHSPPRWYSMLPRRLGVVLARRILDRDVAEHYCEGIYPLSPVRARQLMTDRFRDVQYVSVPMLVRYEEYYRGSDSDDLYDSSRAAEFFFERLLPLVRRCSRLNTAERAFELVFPAAMYRCR